MTIFLFGGLQFAVERHMEAARLYVKVFVRSKILLVLVFLAAVFLRDMPTALTKFLAPGLLVDLVFGLLFWRYLQFSAVKNESCSLVDAVSRSTPRQGITKE